VSSFPGSPKLLKGAIVGVSVIDPLSSVVIFQYNPDTLTRTIRVSAASHEGDKTEALRLKGPPDETVRLDVEIDAIDQLEQGDEAAEQLGVYPALSRLELLLYPSSTTVIANEILAAAGVIEVVAPEAPLTLLVWGPKRVLPVRMNGFTIAEEAFDPNLNPIRAKVSLDLMVLNYQDLGLVSVGGALFMAHQIVKETMAKQDQPASLAAAGATTLGIGG
jgi:Contractile injection system tube protein